MLRQNCWKNQQPNEETQGLPLRLGHDQVMNKGHVNDIYGGKYKDLEEVNHSFEASGVRNKYTISLGLSTYLHKDGRTPKQVPNTSLEARGLLSVKGK
jgi:hypothetical protein